jgi:DNA-binding Lrp family transcriptional regulator
MPTVVQVLTEADKAQIHERTLKILKWCSSFGDTDVIISVRACNLNELSNFVIETLGKIPGVRHTQTYPLPLNTRNDAAGCVRKLGR